MPVRLHRVWSDLAQFHAPQRLWLCLPLLRYTYLFMFALCWVINPIIKGICVQRVALRHRVSAVQSAVLWEFPHSIGTRRHTHTYRTIISIMTHVSWHHRRNCSTEMSLVPFKELKYQPSSLKSQLFFLWHVKAFEAFRVPTVKFHVVPRWCDI